MLNENQIELLPERIYQRLNAINTEYLESIGEVIKEIGELRPSDVHKLQQMYRYGSNVDDIVNKLSKASEKNVAEIYEIFDIVAKENYNYSKPFYKAKGKKFIPYEENESLQKYVKSLAKQTVGEYVNLTQHTAFAVFDKGNSIAPLFEANKNKVATSLSDTYTKVIDYAVTKVQTGVTDYNSAMREVIKALADSGIRTVDYATGYSRRLDTAVRQNVLWGIKQCNQNTADQVGEDFGADGYEISYHSHPRPSHEEMGGKQYAKGEARTVKGVYYPSFEKEAEPLLNEYNCLHFKFSVLLGISQPAYSEEQLEQLKADDKQTFEFEGKEYTKYEASQLQRKIETEVRHQKDRAVIAKAAGNDDLRREVQGRINLLTSKYAKLSEANGLPTKMERMQVKGFRSVKAKTIDKSVESGIMKMSSGTASEARSNAGSLISQDKLHSFSESIKQLGFKLSNSSEFGGFETYMGSPEVLREIVEDLAVIKSEILSKTKVKAIVLKYEDFNNVEDFAKATRKTIIFNKRIYDDSELLGKLYEESVETRHFVRATTYRSVPFHEVGHIIVKQQPNLLKRSEEVAIKKAKNLGISLNEYIYEHISNYALHYNGYVKTELLPEILSGTQSSDKHTRELCSELLGGVLDENR